MYEFISTIVDGTVPTPVAAAVGLFGLGAGLLWMRAAQRDTRRAAIRTASAASTYWVRAEAAHNYVRAIETPTQQIDVTELRAALATPAERLRARVADLADQVREAILPAPAEPDWAEGEMTAAFRAIVDANEWETPGAFTKPGNPSPWVSPIAAGPAPAPSAPPELVAAPRGPQTPPRWQDGGTLPPSRRRTTIQSLAPRERSWTSYLATPELPPFPEPFQIRMPAQRRTPTPALMARLPEDPTRVWRTRKA
jgi:hypothetical protein